MAHNHVATFLLSTRIVKKQVVNEILAFNASETRREFLKMDEKAIVE